MATKNTQESSGSSGLLSELPVDRLKDEVIELGKALAQRGVARLGEGMSSATDKIGDLADAAPGPAGLAKSALKVAAPLGSVTDAASKVKDALPGTDSGDDDGTAKARKADPTGDDTSLKVTNIVETIDVPVSREVAYELWTQFEQFPAFMKKVENVQQKKPQEVTWKAQVFWSHRTWTAKIIDQTPPEHIVWKSHGEKGRVDGAVTFHELAPDLTRILVSLEYHPQGLFERTGNLWRAQGRRVRLELRHFRRHVANHALLHQDEIDGWDGEIHDGKVKRSRGSSAKKSSSGSGNGQGTRKPGAKKSAAKRSGASKRTQSSSGSSSGGSSGSSSGGSSASSSGGSSGARKSTSTASKSPAKKTAARKSTAKKAPASKSTAGGSTAKKTAARKSTASRSTAKKAPAKKAPASKSTAKKAPASRSTAKKSAPRSTSNRTAAAATRSSRTTARTSPRKTATRRTSKSSSSGSRSRSRS